MVESVLGFDVTVTFSPVARPVRYACRLQSALVSPECLPQTTSRRAPDGRIAIVAAQQFGARGVGIEIQPELVKRSRQIAVEGGVADRVEFIEGDLFVADISRATVVMLWLNDAMNARLEPKLRSELRPGTRVVSHQFPIGQWKPDRTMRAEYDGTDLFLWIVQ
jgi:hypothetical protein